MVTTNMLKKITDAVLLATLVFGVLGVVPIFDNFVFFSKYTFFVVGTLLTAVLYVLYTLSKKTIEIKISPLTLPLFLFGVASTASTFFTNNYPVEAVLGFGGVYMALVIISLLGGSVASSDLAKKILPVAGVVSVVLTLGIAAQMIGYGPVQLLNALFGVAIPTTGATAFSLAGSSFFALQILIITLIGIAVEAVAHKHISKWMLAVVPIVVVGVILHLWTVLPGKPGALTTPSWTGSWSIALDTIRSPKAALIGGGASSYSNLYLRFKPIWLNALSTWNVPFSQASNVPFTLLVTMGFFGLATWTLIAWQSVRMFQAYTGTAKSMAAMVAALFVLQLLFPTTISILIVQAVLLTALFAAQSEKLPVFKLQALTMTMEVDAPHSHSATAQKASFPVFIMSGVLLIGVLFSGYHFFKFAVSSYTVMQASKALAAQDIVKTYELQQKAIQFNPYIDVLRRDYALTNMFIATSLSSKTDVTEAEKQQIAQLLQQAVREARSATLLDSLDVENWAVLAQVYKNMIGAVEQADQFAVQSYVQAINNDPTNPGLRIALGGIFLDQKQYQQAASIFQQAVEIKQDFPNAYYNLGYAYLQLGAHKEAQAAYSTLLTLLQSTTGTETEEYKKVSTELEEVNKLVAEDEKNAAKKAGTTTQQQATDAKKSPSILDQSLGENETNVIKAPVTNDVPADQKTNLSGELQTPAPSPAP